MRQMTRRISSRRALVVLAVGLMTACNGGGSSSSGGASNTLATVGELGGMAADPARERVYVADRAANRLLAIDSNTGFVAGTIAFDGAPAGVATDELGTRVYVAVPDENAIVTIDATTLKVVGQVTNPFRPQALQFARDGFVFATTQNGLAEIDVATGAANFVLPGVESSALLASDPDREHLWAVQGAGAGISVFMWRPLLPPSTAVEVLLPRAGTPSGLALAYDEARLLVAIRGDDVVEVLDAETLAAIDSLPFDPGPTAIAANPGATRLYVANGGSLAEGIELEAYGSFDLVLTEGPIQPFGMIVDSSAQHLLVHLEDGAIQSVPLFDGTLDGATVVRAGTSLNLAIGGEAFEGYVLYAGIEPGISELEVPSTPDSRFLDLELASAFVLSIGDLDATGLHELSFPVDADTPAGRVFLQAVHLGAPGGGLRAVGNPLVVRLMP